MKNVDSRKNLALVSSSKRCIKTLSTFSIRCKIWWTGTKQLFFEDGMKKKIPLEKAGTFKVIPTKIVLLHCLLESRKLKNTIMLPSSNLMSTERDSLAWLIFCSTLNALLYGLSLMIYYQDFHFLNNFLSFL